MKKIAILGCGWLGLPLAEKFIEQGFVVKGSTTRPEKRSRLAEKGIEDFVLKLSDELEGDNLEEFFKADLLVLNIPPGRRNPDVRKVFPERVKLVAKAAKKGGVQEFVFVSSTGVYGNSNKTVTEKDVPVPQTASGHALLAAEQFLRQQTKFQTTILRLGGLVGGDRKAGRFLAGKENLPGGNVPVNMLHREDAVAIIAALVEQNCLGETFNICADKHPTKQAFYTSQAIRQHFVAPTFREADTAAYKIISNQKIKAAIGYEFIFPDPMEFE